jgi:serine/threonine-protein kinase
LEKDPDRRLRDIGDMRLALDGAFDTAARSGALDAAAATSLWRRTLPWATGVALSVATGIAVWEMRPAPAREVMRFELPLPNIRSATGPLINISPDGRSVFYVEERASRTRIMRHDLSDLTWNAVPGTEGAESAPFFSPDGGWIGFTTDGYRAIRKVPVTGGSAVTVIRNSGANLSPVWARDGTIVYGGTDGLWRVSAGGGSPERMTKAETTIGGPQALRGEYVVFHVLPRNSADEPSIELLNLRTSIFAIRATQELTPITTLRQTADS